MELEQLVAQLTPDLYVRIRTAVETGKWLDGKPLTDEQRDMCMQAVLVYQAKVEKSGQHMTVGENGEIVTKSRQELKQEMKMQQEALIARFKHDI